MANAYLTITQLRSYYDTRQLAQLSNDKGGKDSDETTLQLLCDTAASELESHLSARITLPLATVPLVLTRWCAARVADMIWGRRNDRPKQVDADKAWADDWLEKWDSGLVSIGVARDLTTVYPLTKTDTWPYPHTHYYD